MTATCLADLPAKLRGSQAQVIFVNDDGEPERKTFGQLYEDAAALEARLIEIGIGEGARIGILAPNSYAWMVWDLACIALRCVSVALTQDRVAETLPALIDRYALQVLAVDPDWVDADALEHTAVVALGFPIPSGKYAFTSPVHSTPAGTHSLVFSSGTTGVTKGLIISTAGTERLVQLYGEAFGTAGGDRFLTFLPFANYQQRMTYYFCIHHGVDFVYCPFSQLFPTLAQHRPTFTIAPPILYESLHNITIATAPRNGAESADVAGRLRQLLGGNIRYLVTGMAPIKRRTLDFYWQHGIPLYEAFGITEAGMVTWNKPGHVKVGSVGTPAEPHSVRLTHEGEIVIRRDALLSLGYFEAPPGSEANTFIGQNEVATGDIGRFDEEGYLSIAGRKKDAIITKSGEKFHPEQIEKLILRDPRVTVAVIMECQSMPGTTAVIALAPNSEPASEVSIRDAIKDLNHGLPVYQQVKEVIFTNIEFGVENGLRTKNSKLNRRAIAQAFQPALTSV